ncbi:MAG TPA: hypothetical protein VMU81_15465 [Acetobacteraceae bacterium]|jgi:hypothetical protein|nr:hypothetical protein [Acetobacteraceae bacterium]
MNIRFIQGQPVVVLERLEDGSVRCGAVSTGRGLAFEFIMEEAALTPEEPNNTVD